MAYVTEELYEKAQKAVEKHKLIFIADIFHFLGIAKSTFYEHFPVESNAYKRLEEMLLKNRIDLKISMRNKWYNSKNPALQVGLMKMIASEEERNRLSYNYNKNENSGDMEVTHNINVEQLSVETLKDLQNAYYQNQQQKEEPSEPSGD